MGDVLVWVAVGLGLVNAGLLVVLVLRRGASAGGAAEDLSRLDIVVLEEGDRGRRVQSEEARAGRVENSAAVVELGKVLREQIREGAEGQAKANEAFGGVLARSLGENAEKVERLQRGIEEKLEAFKEATVQNFATFGREQQARFAAADAKDAEQAKGLREELLKMNEALSGTLLQRVGQLNTDMGLAWTRFSEELGKLSVAQQGAMEQLRLSVTTNLGEMRVDNEKRLEAMRATVEEKLQTTLETRLDASFKQVSERLESVHKGLGEMQTLASGVGDLKKVLTNVKTRGTWGEVLLGNLLEQVLTPEQYEANVATTGTLNRVEYAIKLPGKGDKDGGAVWLPIDSKFPKEDYERLLIAQEAGDAEGAAMAGASLETSIRRFAQDVCTKYVESPKTTDFAIMFLPSEGLYAEVVRRTETVDYLQSKCRVMVMGPTTLGAMLNALQMGFKTLAIQQRSSEVWELLGAVKTEFGKYGDLMDKVQKKLQEASNVVELVGKKSKTINTKLRSVDRMTEEKAAGVFPASLLEDELTEADAQ